MNGPEKHILYLAFCLFILGVATRVVPWGLPAIDNFQVGADFVVPTWNEEASKPVGITNNITQPPDFANNKAETDKEKKPKKAKKPKKTKKKVKLPLNINTASAEELCALNGVGPKLAEKIIAHRESKGAFKGPSDLKKVPGIGAKKLESILPGVIFD